MKLDIKFKAEDFKKKLEQALAKVLSQPQMKALMQETADDIKKRTRLGSGVESDFEPKRPLKPLSSKYKTYRKKNPHKELAASTSPNKSNLTFSGQMLDALSGTSKGPFQGEIFLQDKRKMLTNQSRSFGNNDLAIWNAEKGRNFLALSDLEFKRLEQKIEKALTEELRKSFK